MKVLLMVGSARASSLNKKIAQFIKSQFSDKGTFTIIDQLDLLPFFNPDLEQTTTHDYLNFMMAELKSADKVIFITPEYIHSMPGILKMHSTGLLEQLYLIANQLPSLLRLLALGNTSPTKF